MIIITRTFNCRKIILVNICQGRHGQNFVPTQTKCLQKDLPASYKEVTHKYKIFAYCKLYKIFFYGNHTVLIFQFFSTVLPNTHFRHIPANCETSSRNRFYLRHRFRGSSMISTRGRQGDHKQQKKRRSQKKPPRKFAMKDQTLKGSYITSGLPMTGKDCFKKRKKITGWTVWCAALMLGTVRNRLGARC